MAIHKMSTFKYPFISPNSWNIPAQFIPPKTHQLVIIFHYSRNIYLARSFKAIIIDKRTFTQKYSAPRISCFYHIPHFTVIIESVVFFFN